MASRRPLVGLVFLAASLHLFGMLREPLPAQDGLKFFRVARQFQTLSWAEAVRKSDQHPLYPALIAATEPVVASVIGHGPNTWRISGQLVSMLAALALMIPLHGLARSLFDDRSATLAVFLFLILPLPSELGHDTLSDMTALLAFVVSVRLGECALRTKNASVAIRCGLAAGIGYLARPEVALVPVAVVLTAITRWRPSFGWDRVASLRYAGLSVALLATIGSYALVKGEVSEKLALRLGAGLKASAPAKLVNTGAPQGLDDPKFNFAPKEEDDEGLTASPGLATATLFYRWAGTLGFVLVPLAVYGLFRHRIGRPTEIGSGGTHSVHVPLDLLENDTGSGARFIGIYMILFTLIVIRHASTLGYLSGRHTLPLVVLTLPWVAAGYIAWTRDLAASRGWNPTGVRRRRAMSAMLAIVIGTSIQIYKPGHPSRWGHLAAGRWLSAQTAVTDPVLDTRGWARFVADRPGYDYWHVKQALSDRNLAYVVVGRDELEAESPRAKTLQAILAYAGEPMADFPSRKGGHDKSVWIYRYRAPENWEGLSL